MKILFLTTHDDVFLPRFYEIIFSRLGEDVVGLAIVKDPGFTQFLKNSLSLMGLWLFLREVLNQIALKTSNMFFSIFKSSKVNSLEAVCSKYGISLFSVDKINTGAFRQKLKDMGINLIVSTSCPQILKNRILKLPSKGCINVHYGLLPEYRGMYPSFWVLANGERETGVSVHYMVSKIDAGNILSQIKEKITDDDTFYSLVGRLKTTVGPKALLAAVEKIKKGKPEAIHNDPEQGSYLSFPERKDMIRFLKRGRKWR